MWGMKYEFDCIENMSWVESYENYIKSEQTTALKSSDWTLALINSQLPYKVGSSLEIIFLSKKT